MKIIVNENTALIRLDKSHAAAIFQLVDKDREYLREYLAWVDETKTVENTLAYIDFSEKQMKENKFLGMSIFHNDQLVGQIGFNEIKTDVNSQIKDSKIGYWLGKDFQGNGIITNSCKAFIDYGFREMDFNRIGIHCAAENLPSRAVPERLDFLEECVRRQSEFLHGNYIDMTIYSMTKDYWMEGN